MNLARNGRQDQLGASLVLDVGDWADAVIVEWVEQSLASVIKSSDNWNLATSHCVRNWQIQLQSTFNPKGILNLFLRDLKELLDYTQQLVHLILDLVDAAIFELVEQSFATHSWLRQFLLKLQAPETKPTQGWSVFFKDFKNVLHEILANRTLKGRAR